MRFFTGRSRAEDAGEPLEPAPPAESPETPPDPSEDPDGSLATPSVPEEGERANPEGRAEPEPEHEAGDEAEDDPWVQAHAIGSITDERFEALADVWRQEVEPEEPERPEVVERPEEPGEPEVVEELEEPRVPEEPEESDEVERLEVAEQPEEEAEEEAEEPEVVQEPEEGRRWPMPADLAAERASAEAAPEDEGPPAPAQTETTASAAPEPEAPVPSAEAPEQTRRRGHPLWPVPDGYVPSSPDADDVDVGEEPADTDADAPAPVREPEPTLVVTAVVVESASGPALDRARIALERRGGAVRPEGDDAIVAVFGPDPLDGDGPLRAARATLEARDSAAASAPEEPDGSPAVRAGIGTCDLGGIEPEELERSTGRAVDLAVRLQRMAGPGEVIAGEGVYRLAGDDLAVETAGRGGTTEHEGSTGPLRLLGSTPEATDPLLRGAPLVGRSRELAELEGAFERTVAERAGSIVVVEGESGLGVTRLIESFAGELERRGAATVAVVRCRPTDAGGITLPVADLIERVAGTGSVRPPDRARDVLAALLGEVEDAPVVLERLAHALALPGGVGVPEEMPWAVRRLLEVAAGERPLVILFDDAHLAGPNLLDLLRSIAAQVRGTAVLIVHAGLPRPEGSVPRDVPTLHLGPLEDEAVAELTGHLLGQPLAPDAFEVVAGAARGNPFVVEQVLAYFLESGRLRWEHGRPSLAAGAEGPPMPASLPSLLQTRLRDLPADERAVIDAAAVLGDPFTGPALAELLPEVARSGARDRLSALVHRHLLRVQSSTADGRETFSIRNPLLREAAAQGVDPASAAELHERAAAWIEEQAGERVARSAEAVAAHLESAARARGGPDRPDAREPAARAAGLAVEAARHAEQLGDPYGAAELFSRAAALRPPEQPGRTDLLLAGARALEAIGDQRRCHDVLLEAARTARVADDRAGEWRTKVRLASFRLRTGTDLEALDRVRETADRATEALGELDDDLGLAWAWSLRALVHRARGHAAATAAAAGRAAAHAARTGDEREHLAAVGIVARSLADGPAPVDEAVERVGSLLEQVRGSRPAEQDLAGILALLEARRGRFEDARRLVAWASAVAEELGLVREAATCALRAGLVESLAGEDEAAEAAIRRGLERAEWLGDRSVQAELTARLARVVLDRGRAEEALELAEHAGRLATPADRVVQVASRSAWALAAARLGRAAETLPTAREAVRLAEQTDRTELRAEALLDLAGVLELAGRPNEAAPIARHALRALERKGKIVPASRGRDLLERVTGP